jgi:hypothetical protein
MVNVYQEIISRRLVAKILDDGKGMTKTIKGIKDDKGHRVAYGFVQ